MLEKLGLPSKPANRGAAWVVDASHCQGCSSQFTFINRKHHCRRCGGLFCGSCTQQRMVLRGQGDSPVRICDPCKKLEDAARFELRYGHKNKAAKGNTKQVSKHEEEVLSQILGTDRKQPLLSEHESHTDLSSIGFQKSTNCASSSSFNEKSDATSRDIGILKSLSVGTHGNTLHDIGSISPEELRLQAAEQKKKYRILKGEGKSDEALQAFKSSKELERQAGALELALRKSRRMASMAATVSNVTDVQKADDSEESNNKKLPSQRVKEGKDDLASELRELGWSDADLHDGDKKPTKLMTLEGELSNLLGEMPKKSSAGKGIGGIDKTQVIAHKKKALTLKREGKLAEAKEELKRAKILEKQLEEQELLGEAEESDDELSALIRSMDGDKQDGDEFLLDHAPDPGFNFDHLLGDTNDFATEGNFEVTDDDMNNPELAAALKSFGWSDEEDEHEGASDNVLRPACLDLEALQSEILALKREALSQKRAGNVAEAMSLLKKAKLLEKDLESSQSDVQTYTPNIMEMSSTPHLPFEPSMARTTDEMNVIENVRMQPKSKVMIQRELLSLKKKALALRREGRAEEAEEELKKGKVLEQQLEQMENAPTIPATKYGKKVMEPTHVNERGHGTLDLTNEVEAEVTEQDLHDPALLSVLKNLGWNDDDTNESVNVSSKVSKNINPLSAHDSVPLVKTRKAVRSKAEVQKELLSVKRKALALRRQGKIQEAEEELKRAKDLENEMAAIENASSVVMESQSFGLLIPLEISDSKEVADDARKADSSVTISRIPKDEELEHGSFAKLGNRSEGNAKDKFSILPHSLLSLDMIDSLSGSDTNILSSSVESVQNENQYTEVLSSVNVATQPAVQVTDKVNTSRNNYIFSHTASNSQMTDKPETAGTTTSQSETPERNSELDIDARKAEILAHKRKAVAFKREGNLAEAREVLRQAKLLEKSLEDAQQAVVGTENASTSTDGSSVMQEGKTRQAWKPPSGNSSVMQESRTSQVQKPVSGRDRFKLQQESLSHKRNALKLRREGKIAESEAEFELAKALESQLEELGSQGKAEATADPFVEDLLDPQLMSALKSVGWGDTDFAIQTSEKSEPKTISDRGTNPHLEKDELEEQIKAEKLRALNFKRAGKQAEALEALRAAKRLEKKLGLLT